ncbi:uncharacterized protein LOC110667895 isoform X3 [Hevea brasiliensis]|uniref:uncharacterized protein LOC110667895 isoform X3 n=1 Tax=Hevea brasiliensis TaxID=3981 RepID=UPI0025EBDCCA|nr:uncharacterized protein LOC110667895 isoform X3 [Hevea brasiliensis]
MIMGCEGQMSYINCAFYYIQFIVKKLLENPAGCVGLEFTAIFCTRMAEEESRRRRLPTWMVGATASATVAIDDEDKNKTIIGEPEEENPNLPRNLFAPRTRTKTSKRRKAKNATFENREKIHTHDGDDEDDGEGLTVEDLYMEVNQNSEPKQPLNRKCEPQRQHPTITSLSNDLEGSFIAPCNEQRLPSSETTTSCSSTVSLTSEQSFINVNHTRDPTQDMLHLFLGPLLKKPLLQDKKRSGFFSEDVDLAFELRKQSQNDIREEIVPLTKKKSSLKEKVSLLLD